ncbi:MAG: hypothetical protein HFJ27_03255 [Clostridia bacterium]|nr:hypothetical protein [Clostridia bacterium]
MKEQYGIILQIKEPNDLLLEGKKLVGILTEVSTYRRKVKYLLIGIGFNINQTKFDKEIETLATSLKKEYGKEYSREEIIIEIIHKLEKYIIV